MATGHPFAMQLQEVVCHLCVFPTAMACSPQKDRLKVNDKDLVPDE